MLVEESPAATPTLFEGVPADELGVMLARFERRHVLDGDVLVHEGESTHEMYVIERGAADVFVATDDGGMHHVNRLGPGGVLGEMSLLTDQPASATVRAMGPLDVLVVGGAEFQRLAATYPRIYHNVSAILARKLFQSDRRALQRGPLMHATLVDRGAPALLGYALACSVAWHGQRTTLLLDLAHDELPPEVNALIGRGESHAAGHVEVRTARPEGMYAPAHLPEAVRDLGRSFDYVLIQVPDSVPPLPGGRTI